MKRSVLSFLLGMAVLGVIGAVTYNDMNDVYTSSRETGAGAMAFSETRPFARKVNGLRLRLTDGTGTGTLTVTVDSRHGASYDVKQLSVEMDDEAVRDMVWRPKDLVLDSGDALDVDWSTASTTWTLDLQTEKIRTW